MAIQDQIPKSRLTLKYKTEVNGQPEDVNLPLRMMVLGDFSLGTSKDRKVDLEERRARTLDGKNTDSIMADMGIRLNFVVDNKIDGGDEEMDISLPITKMKDFTPQEVAKNVPKLNSLLLVKKLLLEVMSSVDNKKEFRKLLNKLLSDETALAKVLEDLKEYESLKLPSGEAGAAE